MPKRDFYQVSLKLILKNNEDEILILNGHSGGTFAGFFDLPGGRIDEEEFTVPVEKIIQREIAEEIGNIEVSVNPKPVAIGRHLIPASITREKKDVHIFYVFFEAKHVGGEIKISAEHEGSKWVDLNKDDPSKLFTSGILEGINIYLSKK